MLDISNIKIVGVGGAGLSILENIAAKIPMASLVAIDTDANALEKSSVERKILLIENGEGTGGDTEIAKKAAASKATELSTLTFGTRLMIIIAGFGGGTGSVVAPMISKISSENPECEILSFAALPLSIEGEEKNELAKKAQAYMSRRCRATFSLPNDIILAKQNLPIAQAYANANDCISNVVSSAVISASANGIVNIDYPTFIKIFSVDTDAKASFAAFGRGWGDNAVEEAIEGLSQSPLLPQDFKARTMLLSLRCPPSFEMNKMQMLLESAARKFGTPQRFAFGAIAEESFDENIEVCAMGLCDNSRATSTQLHTPTDIVEPVKEVSEPEPKQEEARSQTTLSNELETEESQTESTDEHLPEEPAVSAREEVKIEPPLERMDVSVKPVPVKSERRSFFGFGRRKKSQKKGVDENIDKQQTEFKFMELSEQRGFFHDTPPNIRNGEDLDVPTYMRRGIKINL